MAMDTDDDESEVDDGEEEQRVQRRQRRLRSPRSTGGETMATIEIDMTIDRDLRKKPIIEFRLPQRLGPSQQVCIWTCALLTKAKTTLINILF